MKIRGKKLALLLFGMSKQEYIHWKRGKKLTNYENSYDNYQEYIYNFFLNKGYNIDIYFVTNILDDIEKDKILNKYKPINYEFIGNKDNIFYSRNLKFKRVIELCIESKITYDLVLITRFDLHFKKNFNNVNIKFDKLNLVSILEKPNLICDNFYLFPYKYLNDLLNVVNKNIYKSFHYIKDDIENINGKNFVNYIFNENLTISKLSFYKIVEILIK